MIRHTLLWLFISAICITTWRDRFLALCGLILLSVLSQHPDMPTNIMGVPGLNPWNICFFVIVLSWFTQSHAKLPSAPTRIKVLFGLYFLMLMIGGIIAILDFSTILERWPILSTGGYVTTESEAWKDLIVNPAKYLLVGLLFYSGCDSRKRAWQAVWTICLLGVLYALLTYKTMKLAVFLGNYEDARRMTSKLIGLHANDLAGLLTTAFWAIVAVAFFARGKARFALLAVAALVLPTIVGCHSRAAYIANVAIAFVLAIVRWRWMLIGFPIAAAVAIVVFPQIAARMGMDLQSTSAFQQGVDWNQVTAGRTENIWMPVFPEIEKSIFIGHGRLGIGRTNATFEIARRERFVPTHPHNSYLEILLDFGLVGLTITLLFLGSLAWMALELFRSKHDDPLVQIAGAIGFIAIVNVMVLGLSSQFFYPKESLLWLFTASALSIRMWTIQQARRNAGVEMRDHVIVENTGAYGHFPPLPGYNH